MRPSQLLVALAACSTLTSAWPWPPFAWEGANSLVERQNNGGGGNGGGNGGGSNGGGSNGGGTSGGSSQNSASQSASQGSTATVSAAPITSGGSGSPSQTQSGNKSGQASGTTTTATVVPSINPQDPAGGVSMIQPAISSGTQYYRSGAPVTFIWEYTSLLVKPTAIDVIATIASTAGGYPQPTFTLASNQSFAKTQTVIWDTAMTSGNEQLPVAMYTLVVYDASNPSGVSAVPSAGYLGAAQYAFGMYTHRPLETAYPDSQQICVTCNAAGGRMEFLAGGLFFTIVGGTMASFFLFL